MSYGAKSYKQTSIKTASKEKVLLMLYEACIKNMKLAKVAMEKNKIAEKCEALRKSADIIHELTCALDHEKGGAITEQLENLYSFCSTQLTKTLMNNDTAALDSVIRIITTLYEGWVVAVDDVMKSKGEGGNNGNKT